MIPLPESLYNWQTNDHAKFDIEEWDEEALVFHVQSGETHQLNTLAVDVLKIIIQKPISFTEILNQLRSEYPIDNSTELSKQLETLICQFDNLGLIEPHLK